MIYLEIIDDYFSSGATQLNWRWDQGRLYYFGFDSLKTIAHTLVTFDTVQINTCEPLFRQQLEDMTGLPFAPKHYAVLRNYKRVFECALLATVIDKRLQCTDICREMAKANSSLGYVDEYFSQYIPRFRYPFPAFTDYTETAQRVYPFCAVMKYLAVRLRHGLEPRISVNDILTMLVANNCTGYEDREYFLTLTPQMFTTEDDQKRQVREMLIFMSQMTILKMHGEYLYLDTAWSDDIDVLLDRISTPFGTMSLVDRNTEFFNQARMNTPIYVPTVANSKSYSDDIEFIEGKRKRVEHLRIERSPLLRKYYMAQHPNPICQMCNVNMTQRYPWTEYLLEIHHLLPLSSALLISPKGTSLDDVVGLCPSCHRSLHSYYRQWLDGNNRDDFTSKQEVMGVYEEARERIAS